MSDTDSVRDDGYDPQDSAEVYDETHLDDEGEGDALLDELADVYDATRPHDERTLRLAPDEVLGDDEDSTSPLETEANALLASDPADSEEIELVYTGLMRNQRGAQGSASHWEAKRLSDEDVERLGYNNKDTAE